jgi:Protein of unknown function (DUF1569)
MNPARRPLAFASLDRVMPDVDRLLLGHRTVGKWTLGQICNHLAGGLIATIDGFPFQAPWIVRLSVGPLLVRRLLRRSRFPEGAPLPKRFSPKPGRDARAEAESLRAAIGLLSAHTGPFAAHPFGARFSRADWQRFHCIHCAHHLSFVLPE